MQDKIIKMLAYEGRVLVTCASTTNLVEKAKQTHDLSPLATAAFGRMLTITSIMGAELKGENSKLTARIQGNGDIGTMLVTANSKGKVKGYVGNPHVDLPLNEFEKLDVGAAVGFDGYLHIIKDVGMKEPYVGISNLVTGEIGDDFARYFVDSEQKRSAVALGVLVNKDGVKSAGGYLINVMPDISVEEVNTLEKSVYEAGAISKMLDRDLSLLDIAKKITGDDNVEIIEEEYIPEYLCDCSIEKMEKGLISVGKKDLQEMADQEEKIEMVCEFCNSKYEFTKNQLEKLIESMEEK